MLSSYGDRRRDLGTTLVEVALAMLLLSIIAVGGGAFLYYSSGSIGLEQDKSAALEMANRRLEELRASAYADISPMPAEDWAPHNIKRSSGNWVIDGVDDETVTINSTAAPITATVQYVDDDPVSASYDYLLAIVRIGYRPGSDDSITLETYISP